MNDTTRTPPPTEKTVRDALLRALRVRGLEPQESWVSVRLAYAPWPRERAYTVVIAYQPARVPLARVLRRSTGSFEREPVGVWVLDEAEARQLCEGA